MAPRRVRVFIDFWNFQLSMSAFVRARARQANARCDLDWMRLGPWLADRAIETLGGDAKEAGEGGPGERFAGLHVYASHDPFAANNDRFRRFAHMLGRFPGVTLVMKERRPKSSPHCPACHGAVDHCPDPGCHASMRGTEEKGIDTAIVTDMIGLAWEGAWDVAVLASADADFLPAVDALQAKGLPVVHVGFPGRSSLLARRCAGSIDASRAVDELRRAA